MKAVCAVFWTALLALPVWAAAPVSYAQSASDAKYGKVIGVANNQVIVASVTGTTVDVNHPFNCPLAGVQQGLGRTPEPGDQVQLGDGAVKTGEPDPRCIVRPRAETVGFFERLGAVAASAILVIVVASLAAGQSPAPGKPRGLLGAPTKFLLGDDGRYSNSQCQLALWFGMAMTMYLAMVALRVAKLDWDYLDGVSLTANVMALTGLSALTFGAAKVVTAQKVENAVAEKATAAATAAATTTASPAKIIADATSAATSAALTGGAGGKPSSKPNILTDLFQNDHGKVDVGDFQMIFVAVTAVVIFALSCFHALATLPYQVHVSLPDVDSSLLAGFGIGQGAYLVKKAAMPLGKG